MAALPHLLLLLLTATTTPAQCHRHNHKHHHTTTVSASAVQTICHTTPHPTSCLASAAAHLPATLDATISVPLLPTNILSVVLASLRSALSAVSSVSPVLSSALSSNTDNLRRGAAQDCVELHDATLASLSRSAELLANPGEGLPAVRAHLAAALTNKATCLDGLAGVSSTRVADLFASLDAAYEYVSNSLSLVARHGDDQSSWAAAKIHNRRLLQDDDDSDDNGGDDNSGDDNDYGNDNSNGDGDEPVAMTVITVAKDGTGDYTTVAEAVSAAPNNSDARTVIQVKAGTYEENVEVPPYKTNIAMIGEGRDVTVITGSRSAADGWSTFRTATIGVAGEGFLARDITFRNTAGAAKGQAVALRINADHAAVYRCGIDGHQDVLYAHSFRQFYRECVVSGTVDVVFGNAAAALQGCALFAKNPLPGQDNVLTAQNRGDPNEDTGFALLNCTVAASTELLRGGGAARTYLGRPWGTYSRAVYVESYLGELVDGAGWAEWPVAGSRTDLLYYGEYGNSGPGAATDRRVGWAGYHVMGYDEATGFSVENFIYGDEWLGSTSFPYDEGI